MAYPPQMMPRPMMPQMPQMMPRMQPMMQSAPRPPSSDSSILILLVLFMCIICVIGGVFFYIQSEGEEDKVTNCSVYNKSECNSETQCSWDSDLFMCIEDKYDMSDSEATSEQIIVTDETVTDVPCLENQRVQSNTCVDCKMSSHGPLETRAAGDPPSGLDTQCFKSPCLEAS